jgi:hypothetical protein
MNSMVGEIQALRNYSIFRRLELDASARDKSRGAELEEAA